MTRTHKRLTFCALPARQFGTLLGDVRKSLSTIARIADRLIDAFCVRIAVVVLVRLTFVDH